MRKRVGRFLSGVFALSFSVTFFGIMGSNIASAVSVGYSGSDVLGQPDFTTTAANTTSTGLESPDGTALDTVHHRFFVSDAANNRVLVFNLDTNNNLVDYTADNVLGQTDFTSLVGATTQSGLSNPYGLAYDSQNNRLFVSDKSNHRVLDYDFTDGISDGMDAANVLGQVDFDTSNNSDNQSKLLIPESLALDTANQRLFVTDSTARRVLVFDVSPDGISDGMDASYVLGQANFTTFNPATTQSGVKVPEGLAFNEQTQQLFVGDSFNDRVMVFSLSGGISNGMNASFVLGQADFTSGVSAATQSGMGNDSAGIGVDSVRNLLYVQDNSHNRILVFNLSAGISNGMNATLVLGQVDFTSSDNSCSTASAVLLCLQGGNISVDTAKDRIYVPDRDNNRVMIFDFAHVTTAAGSLPVGALGTSYDETLGSSGSQCTQTFGITSGSLPPGLSLNVTTGQISGVPSAYGSHTFEIAITDDCGSIGSSIDDPSYTINIPAPAAPNTGYAKSASGGLLPAGLMIAGALGLVSVATFRLRYNKKTYGK